ncbi:MAG: lysylphosphatidylglycerol synthase transmembrane domain-containing protein [Myxococcota bacterium]
MWSGVAVTGFFIWLVFRDVDFGLVGEAIAQADWLILLGVSIPAYLLCVFLRALRWRYLTDPIQPISTAALFRAVSIGFMANNIFPLRMGEVLRAWYLSRETGAPTAALFGTVILERVVDTVTVIALAALALGLWGAGSGGLLARGVIFLIPVALAPLAALVALRLAPERFIALAGWLLGPFPERVAEYVQGALGRFEQGLGALSGGIHLFWIAAYSLVIWLVASTIPILAGFAALGIEFHDTFETLIAAWVTLSAVGMAVAIPSAPGFFGTYHAACKLALEPFGVPPETAVALGTLVHGVFWLTLTLLGFAVLRLGGTSLSDLDQARQSSPPE